MVAIPSTPEIAQPSALNASEADSGEKYTLGTKKVSAAEFQAAIDEYETRFPQELQAVALPKKHDNKYAGILVYNCIGAFRGDEYCTKCPIRRSCIQRR